MKRIALAGVLSFLLLVPLSAQADLSDFLQYFVNPNWGEDPLQPDTFYVVCDHYSLQIWLKTDNQETSDFIAGIYIPLILTTTQTGLVLDTTVQSVFGSGAIGNWGILPVQVYGPESNPTTDPSVFPMRLLLGGVATSIDDTRLGPGNHLIARLYFATPAPEVCVDTISLGIGTDYPLYVATHGAYPPGPIDYRPQWRPACCGPVVPTLSRFGLLIFGVLLFGLMVYAIKKAKRVFT